MSPNYPSRKLFTEEQGFGLIAAMFAVVILALFGVLITRYISTTTLASADDYQWAQTLYSAESVAHQTILFHDGGGNFGGAPPTPVIQNVVPSITDGWTSTGNPSTLKAQGSVTGTNISRTIEVKYIL